jgi:hypothetical protein
VNSIPKSWQGLALNERAACPGGQSYLLKTREGLPIPTIDKNNTWWDMRIIHIPPGESQLRSINY